ncbi:MAG: TonB-dependent receptor [Odoribacter sp.]|nr:TonB-dependent receptor [Odoribacter sp.]
MKYDVIAAPEHKLYVGGDYLLNKWTFSTGVQFIHNLITDDGKETFTLWNARVNYRATDFLDVFARGENLLAQKYEINTGYPMPRATVFAGLSFKF